MNVELADATRLAAKREAGAMIDENWADVLAAYSDALIASNPDAKFKFNVGLAIALEPEAGGIKVSTKISFSVKHTDESAGVVCDGHPKLPGMGDETKPQPEVTR